MIPDRPIPVGTAVPDADAELRRAGRGAVFLALFGAVFAATGLWSLLHALPEQASRGDDEGALAAAVVGSVFTAAGIGAIALAAFSRRRAGERAEQRRRRTHFCVPVFVTEDSDASWTGFGVETPELRDALAAGRPPPGSKIGVVPRPDGGIDLAFGAARNKGVSAGLTAFTALWTGITALLSRIGAPLLFPIVFGLFAALLWLCVLDLWTGTTRVVADRRGVTVTRRILGIAGTRRVAACDLERVEVDVGMQSGTRVFYRLRAIASTGRRIGCGSGIPDKREAEALAARIESSVRGAGRGVR